MACIVPFPIRKEIHPRENYYKMSKRKVWIGVALALIGATSVFCSIEQGSAAIEQGTAAISAGNVAIEAERSQLLIDAAAAHEKEWFERKNSDRDKLQ